MSLGEHLGGGTTITRGLWHLNGSSADSSGNGNNGTDTAITYSLANGKFGQGGSFNGTTSCSVIANAASLRPAGNFTISAWVNCSSANVLMVFQSFELSATSKYYGIALYINAGKVVVFSGKGTGLVAGTDYQAITGNTSVNNSVWHNVIGVWDGSYLRVYVDGKSDATAVAWANAAVYTTNNFINLGKQQYTFDKTPGYYSTAFYAGKMDEVIVEGVAWTPVQVQKYFTFAKGRFGII